MLKRKSREVRSDMETKGMRYKAWSKLKTVYGERFILLLTDQVRLLLLLVKERGSPAPTAHGGASRLTRPRARRPSLRARQATKNGFMEQWIRKLNKFNIYYKQFSFGGRRRKVVAIVMEVPNNTLELAAEAMKLQKQVCPHDGPPSPYARGGRK